MVARWMHAAQCSGGGSCCTCTGQHVSSTAQRQWQFCTADRGTPHAC